MDKYRGRVIRDEMYDRDITVEYIFDLKFEDLDLEDQKLAMKVGWAFGVGNKTDFEKCTQFKGYLFTPRQWRLWHAKEKYPALISGEGTGKSLIFWLFLIRVCLQYPGTRTLFMRETYAQLTSASLPTLWKIFAHFGWEENKHFIHHVSNKKVILKVGNKESELLYMAAQNENGDVMDVVRNIRSLEVDCIVADEIANIHELVFLSLRSRVGRWGRVKDANLRKLIAGGNPASEGSWQHNRWYKKLNGRGDTLADADQHTVFGGSTYENRRNVAPEIIEALETSDDYWRNTFLYGYPGFMPPSGEPVYKNFKYETYVSMQQLEYSTAVPLLRGWDIGPTAVNKACAVAQLDSRGILIVLAEFTMNDPGVMRFGEYVSEQCNIMFPGVPYIRDFTDPVAFDISQTDMASPAMRLYELGIVLYPGEEKFQARHDAVVSVMNRLVDGTPGLRIDGTRCRKLVDGFLGGYRYKTVDATHERYSREPLKDIYSHIHDAFQYLCSRLFHADNRKRDNSPRAQRRRDRALLNKRKRHMGGYTQAKLDRLRG